ncbi:MAG: HupE / UreJ protein [Flavobacteriaceae bacterium]|uniref:HupE/UreJ family protein n=1 Tax=Winogradskyella sp. SYSU M77433 TaxID=3042722 RepID=UPI000C4A9BE5|nr:HupE/UreJ family protein [Winogradskyella sp. SYSU M77433]MAX71080.1 HupE / UreJ protein [Flavobacteriaceae bacterium]MDH7913428.1 HupE/UreJ family protein [Winogradskyella sp. SYSU M77433]
MLDNFWFNVQYGINHVLDLDGYDHVLFLMVLAVPYLFKDWKRVLLLVSVFTLGHTLSLVLASYGIVSVNGSLVEFLIPVTILITAIYNVFTAGKKERNSKISLLFFSTLFFGLIHGLGFAREFKMFAGQSQNRLELLIEFALGIEIAQIIIVFVVLFIGFLCQTIFRFSRRDWVMVLSSIVIGLVIPMIIHSELLN